MFADIYIALSSKVRAKHGPTETITFGDNEKNVDRPLSPASRPVNAFAKASDGSCEARPSVADCLRQSEAKSDER